MMILSHNNLMCLSNLAITIIMAPPPKVKRKAIMRRLHHLWKARATNKAATFVVRRRRWTKPPSKHGVNRSNFREKHGDGDQQARPQFVASVNLRGKLGTSAWTSARNRHRLWQFCSFFTSKLMLVFLEIKQNHRPPSMFLTKMQSSTNHLIWIAPAQHLAKLKIKQAVTTPHEAAVHCTKTVVRANLATAADAHLGAV